MLSKFRQPSVQFSLDTEFSFINKHFNIIDINKIVLGKEKSINSVNKAKK